MKKIFIAYFVLILLVVILLLMKLNKLPFGGGFSVFQPNASVTIRGNTFQVILAKSKEEVTIGLSKTAKLDQDKGMLFLLKEKALHKFWMRDMKFPIDIIYINDDKIVDIVENAPIPQSTSTAGIIIYQPKEIANYVLEINSGSSSKNKIKIGDKVEYKNIK